MANQKEQVVPIPHILENNRKKSGRERYISHLKRGSTVRRLAALVCLSVAAGVGSSDTSAHHSKNKISSTIENTSESYNWAGYEASTPSALNFIQDELVVPSLSCPETGDYDASAWVGLGSGSTGDTLYQTGIGMACNSGEASYRDWWEDYPNESEQDFDPGGTISAGDYIMETVTINQYGPEFFVQDLGSSGESVEWSDIKQLYVSSVSPSQVECIVERPESGGSYENLTDFGTLDITSYEGCNVVAGGHNHKISSTSPGISGVSELDMYNVDDDPLALTSGPSSSGEYTVTWEASS